VTTIDVRYDNRRLLARLESLRTGVKERATSRALNRTITTVRAEAAREISRELGPPFRVGTVRGSLRVKRATRASLTAILTAGGRRNLPLGFFRARQTRTGVSARVGGRAVTIPGAFINDKYGRDVVRVRAASFKGQQFDAVSRRNKRVQRRGPDFPVAEVLVPGIPARFIEQRVQQKMTATARTRFSTVLAQEIAFERGRVR
jgi:hypothetical protein